jgi:hypothetical protein
LSPNNQTPGPKPRHPFAAPAPAAKPKAGPSGVQIFCPACGILVRLPANECPQCRADLRTGLKPEEYVPIWKRGKTKLLLILTAIALPTIAWSAISSQTEEGLLGWLKDRIGLESCADPRDMWDEFDQAEFEKGVHKGFDAWSLKSASRRLGLDPNGPEPPEEAAKTPEEKARSQDTRNFFALTLMSSKPSDDLKPLDNWYTVFPGEWDVAYMTGQRTPDERVVAGEWTFAWINDGQALQDVMSVPYRWQEPPADFKAIQSTSTRIFNPKFHVWEGFHIVDNQLIYFRSARSQDGKIMENYQLEGGIMVVTVFSELTEDSFKATVSRSTNNGASYVQEAEIWAKRREVTVQ